VPQLETLILEGCTSLVEIHESIGCLKNLVLLNLRGCKSLVYFPCSISNFRYLEFLDLVDCLQVNIGSMFASTELLADEIGIKQSPRVASLSGCNEQSSKSWLSLLSSLMSPKSLNPICFIPHSVSRRSLTTLNLSGHLSEDVFRIDF